MAYVIPDESAINQAFHIIDSRLRDVELKHASLETEPELIKRLMKMQERLINELQEKNDRLTKLLAP